MLKKFWKLSFRNFFFVKWHYFRPQRDSFSLISKIIPSCRIHSCRCRHLALIRAENCHRRAFVWPPAVATLPHMGPVGGPSWLVGALGVVRAKLRVLTLSQWRKVFVYLWQVWQESWPNFKGWPKVSEVATNHWVFLRCYWSPISSWFYYQS